MQKIPIIISVLGALCAPTVSHTQDIVIPLSTLETCFSEADRLPRLACYDRVLERPELTDTVVEPSQNSEATDATTPRAIKFANMLLKSPEVIDDKVHMTLVNRADGSIVDTNGEELEKFLSTSASGGSFEKLRLESDLFLALKSQPEIGENAILAASCENDITRFKLYFPDKIDTKFEDVRLYSQEKLVEHGGIKRKFWVRGDGYILENARGLPSIRLLKQLSSAPVIQISIGKGDTLRSAFFKTQALNQALPYVARHCTWATGG